MPEKLTRRERERQRHRREILAAAQEVFARRGYEGASMAKIAQQAEFAVGTLYKFFKDKKSLYRALITDTLEKCGETLLQSLASPGTEVEKLEAYIETKARLFVQHIPTARLYLSQTAGAMFIPVAGLDRDARAVYDRILDALESTFRAGIRKKLFNKEDPRMLAIALEGVSNCFIDTLVERPEEMTAETMANLTRTIFFHRVCMKKR